MNLSRIAITANTQRCMSRPITDRRDDCGRPFLHSNMQSPRSETSKPNLDSGQLPASAFGTRALWRRFRSWRTTRRPSLPPPIPTPLSGKPARRWWWLSEARIGPRISSWTVKPGAFRRRSTAFIGASGIPSARLRGMSTTRCGRCAPASRCSCSTGHFAGRRAGDALRGALVPGAAGGLYVRPAAGWRRAFSRHLQRHARRAHVAGGERGGHRHPDSRLVRRLSPRGQRERSCQSVGGSCRINLRRCGFKMFSDAWVACTARNAVAWSRCSATTTWTITLRGWPRFKDDHDVR